MDHDLIAKVILFAAAFVGLLFVGRLAAAVSRASRSPDNPAPPTDAELTTVGIVDRPPPSAPASHPEPVELPESMRSIGGTPLQLRSYFFEHCDGTDLPDTDVFFDDLHLDIYDPRTGRAWTQAITIATPGGLAEQLHQNRWDYLEGDGMLVLPRFNLQAVLRAAMQRIADAADDIPGSKDADSPSLAL